jgi:hypothetical protein
MNNGSKGRCVTVTPSGKVGPLFSEFYDLVAMGEPNQATKTLKMQVVSIPVGMFVCNLIF